MEFVAMFNRNSLGLPSLLVKVLLVVPCVALVGSCGGPSNNSAPSNLTQTNHDRRSLRDQFESTRELYETYNSSYIALHGELEDSITAQEMKIRSLLEADHRLMNAMVRTARALAYRTDEFSPGVLEDMTTSAKEDINKYKEGFSVDNVPREHKGNIEDYCVDRTNFLDSLITFTESVGNYNRSRRTSGTACE